MIRPSPTSITLSASDVSAHLQHIDIYHGLLKQGFKKREIQRFLRKHRQNTTQGPAYLSLNTSLQAPSCVELASRRLSASTAKADATISGACTYGNKLPTQGVEDDTSQGSVELETDEPIGRNVTSDDQRLWCEKAFPPVMLREQPEDNATVPKDAGKDSNDSLMKKTHIPRKSSLLRFADTVSTDEEEQQQPTGRLPYSPHSQIRYRPRTDTCSYEQSAADEEVLSSSSLITVFEELTLDGSLVPATITAPRAGSSKGDAQESAACESGSSSPTLGTLHIDIATSERTIFGVPGTETMAVPTARIVPMLRSREGQYQQLSADELQSSPPLTIHRSPDGRLQRLSSPALPPRPFTPSRQQRPLAARTEPRGYRFQYVDGPSFTPYNDSIPASMQPQTPADLVRASVIDESNARYTAPPGRLRNDASPLVREPDAFFEEGQQSPTNRAIQMRRRRNREFARSARIESLRINRLRRRQQSGDNGWVDEEHANLWRDDLDADRAGEENFEDLERPALDTDAAIRVVSGNRHVNEI